MFENKVAVVTGAASGIGRATVDRLIGSKCGVVAFDRDAGGLTRLASELGAGALLDTIDVDISDEASVNAGMARTIEKAGKIDFLINSAGIDHLDRVAECSLGDWRRILSVNLDGTFLMCRIAVRHMIERKGGRIVNVASWLAKSGMAGHAPYAASKFGMLGLTQSLAKEVAEFGITVNAVCPGPIDHTRMRAEADQQSLARGLSPAKDRVKMIPLGRMGEPDDVAGLIAFLLSEDASYMTGQAINITGGLWMN
ncbi:SDR family NAD(P)-dependent oxidoreductase [Methylocapsa sp. S129]|uniref:SDR family NAD(P)-dependent oxidoreductase n=1 Tax=Methylocapsa sp. S129 TaxID=1641869 RepID=UPI00131E5D21|nr:SDR family NAD(P)-dependent oxidoreductase [Methylocapsa sp. S129]